MNSRRASRQSTGWGTVVAVAFLGLALAALVVLTPWRIGEPPGTRGNLSNSQDAEQAVSGQDSPETRPVVFVRR